MNESKACSICKQIKLLNDFNNHPKCLYGKSNKCRECSKAYDKTNRLNNSDRVKANSKRFRISNPTYMRNWRKEHSQEISSYYKKWYENNPSYFIKYRLDNPEYSAMQNAIRRTRIKQNGIFYISKKEIANLYSKPCAYCGETKNIQIDHVVPINKGGAHSIGNLLPACAQCNQSKNDTLLFIWLKKKTLQNKLQGL